MSSFGGETPINIPSAIITPVNASYTVPAGRYAKLFGYFQFSYPGTGTVPTFSVGGLSFSTSEASGGFYLNGLVLNSGQSISGNAGAFQNIKCHIGIVEFNNP